MPDWHPLPVSKWGSIPLGTPPFSYVTFCGSYDTERVRALTTFAALSTYCLRCIPFSCAGFLPLFRYRAVPRRPDLTDRVRDENINGDSPLAAGVAAVVFAATVPVVVIAAAATAGDQQNQDDDPPAVIAAKPIVTTHNRYLRNLLSDSLLIPWYSGNEKMCGGCRAIHMHKGLQSGLAMRRTGRFLSGGLRKLLSAQQPGAGGTQRAGYKKLPGLAREFGFLTEYAERPPGRSCLRSFHPSS